MSSPSNQSFGESDRSSDRSTTQIVSYWFNLVVQPILAVVFVIGLAWLFGYLQRNHDWFNDAAKSTNQSTENSNSQFACSMLCVIVQAPGRCPVCGMELQEIKPQGDPKDLYGLTIDPAARRLANIETVVALRQPTSKEIEVPGRISYDETTEFNVSSYIDGRIDDLLIDYTGATIRKNEGLAIVYSPGLYADQAGLIQAKAAFDSGSTNERVSQSNQRLYESARQRLIEKGIPENQISEIEKSGEPQSRIKIFSPSSGTVVKKLVAEGSYVKTGTPILKVADLAKVWMLLEMYPEHTANLKIGQSVNVSIRSQPGKTFEGTISFIDPSVDTKTNTVRVRVVIPNEAGLIKIGDYGNAQIDLKRTGQDSLVVVPRESVLINGSDSIAYVETTPGRFEFRKIEIAEFLGDKVTVAAGIKEGEMVVSSGAFMVDSNFNIQGKVSLIDPNRTVPKNESAIAKAKAEADEIERSFKNLTQEDRKLAESQVICPVAKQKLGTGGMGTPIRIQLAERDVMICCAGCETSLKRDPGKYLAILDEYNRETSSAKTNSGVQKPPSESSGSKAEEAIQ